MINYNKILNFSNLTQINKMNKDDNRNYLILIKFKEKKLWQFKI